ncbi:hypothetical protein [Mesoaciditoga lauensis]|uniref:hypothetical protein n=1 Tax=Mesoaciditoga lauensis TaxID=1495039 RepID=UPI00055B4B91|nr:hypothetical protein [Mesoaciditoga lauensis]
MKKEMMFVLILLILTTLALSIQITIYKWNSETQNWEMAPSSAASAEAYDPWCEGLTSSGGNHSIGISVGITNSCRALTAAKMTGTLETKIYGKWMTDDVFDLFKSGKNISISYFSNGPAGIELIKTEKNVPVKKVVALLGTSIFTQPQRELPSTFYLWLGTNGEFQQEKPKEGDYMIVCVVPKI